MAHKVKCLYCGEIFDRDKIDCIKIGNRYAHVECAQHHDSQIDQIEKDKKDLDEFIKHLFNVDTIPVRIRKQINDYIKNKNYTYSGIMKTLDYFFVIKKNSLDKSNGGIGIVPFVYDEAKNYFYQLWLANHTNHQIIMKKDISYHSEEIVVPVPQKAGQKRHLFTFLDEEENQENDK